MQNVNRNIAEGSKSQRGPDWPFLIFLIGASYSKTYVKVMVIVAYLFYCYFKNYRFPRLNSVNKFYFLIIISGALSSFVQKSFSDDVYIFTFGFGVVTWVAAGIISYLLYVSVANVSTATLHRTLKGFFALNALASFLQVIEMMIQSGHPVPYWYWDSSEYFGSSTGDHVHGLFANVSITNATISMVGAVYFLYNKELKWALLCLFVSLLCTSNATLLLSMLVFCLMLFFARDRTVKKYTVLAMMMIGLIYPLLTAENVGYIGGVYKQGTKEVDDKGYVLPPTKDAAKAEDDLSKSLLPLGQYVQKNYYAYDLVSYTSFSDDLKYVGHSGTLLTKPGSVNLMEPEALKRQLQKWYGFSTDVAPIHTFHKPLKLYSHVQTYLFLKERLANLFFGAGIANFSSKIAVKATGLNLHGGYSSRHTYASQPFSQYHLYTVLYIFSLPISEHSVINFPNSIYNQIAGEYGLAGMALFVVFYLGWFYRKRKALTVGWFVLPLVLMFFEFEYWFEMISLSVLFELIMFIDIYKSGENVETV